ncbi:MAG: hypothetical protein M0R40_00075 [Firmicutes bacterium]|nr:hypothetical protein [Bacillota bacterium]
MADYLVKHSFGCIRHFCHSPRNGIYLCTMTDARITGYEVIMADGQSDYDILIDDNDITHITCQDSEGNIIYIKNEKGKWEKYTLLKSKSSSSYSKNFNIFHTDNLISVIYAVDYKGKRLLSHHMIESSDVPVAIDYAAGDFSCAKDNNGNIHLLYTNGNGVPGWRQFSWNTKQWGEFTPTSAESLKSPYVFVNDKIHAAGVTADNKVVYLSQGEQKVVGEHGKNPIIMQKDSEIYVMWESPKDARVYASPSSDNGNTFSQPIEFMPERFVPVKLFGLAATSFEQCGARHCYGYIKDNIVSLFLMSNFLKVNKTPPQRAVQPEPKANSGLHLLKLETEMRHMDNIIAEIDFRLCMIEKAIKDLNEKQYDLTAEQSSLSLENEQEVSDEEQSNENPENGA